MTLTYLWDVLDECDAELDVGEVAEIGKPGDHLAYRHKQRNHGEEPGACQKYETDPWHSLTTTLKADETRWTWHLQLSKLGGHDTYS